MQKYGFVALATLAFTTLAMPASGQEIASIRPGDTLRVTAPRISGVHIVLANNGDALDLRDRKGVLRAVPASDLRRVERLEGRSKVGGAVHGGFLGLLGGAAIGAGIGHLADDPDAFIPGSVVGAALGGVVGLVIGGARGAKRGSPRWRAVRLAAR